MNGRLRREIVRIHAIFRAIAPFLPSPLVRLLRFLKRGLTANRLFRLVTGRAPADRRKPSEEVARFFDVAYYREQTGSSDDPKSLLSHYRRFGWQSGLDPNPFFDVRGYMTRAREMGVSVGGDPFEHYFENGWKLGLEPSGLFDGSWYAAKVGLEESCPFIHYLDHGQWIGLPTSPALERALSPTLQTTLNSDERVSIIPLPGSEIRLVTLDFWDTLVLRTRPADSAKLATARRICRELRASVSALELFARRVRIEAELAKSNDHGEYHISDVVRLLLESLIDEVDAELVAELVSAEIDDECRHTRLNPEAVRYLNDLRQGSGERSIAVLSDFYMSGSDLRKILEHHGIDSGGLHFVSSCDFKASKRLGDLYGLVHRTFDVTASEHFHVGDNEFSDVEMAKKNGVQAYYLPALRELPGPGELSKAWFESNSFDEGCSRIGSLLSGDSKRTLLAKRTLFAGSRSAFLPVALVFAAAQRASERGLGRVFYVSREGAFLSELHRRISDEHPELRFPSAVHLEVSRRSTFGASLSRLDGPNLDRLWSQYPHQSIQGLLSSLGVDSDELGEGIHRFGLDPDEVIHEIRSNSRVREFLADTEVESTIMRSLKNQRELLVRYLRDRGVTADQALVVDLGWRGTIQDNFAHILTDVHFHGVYMGLFPYLNRQPVNVSKEALAFDGNLGDSFDHVSPPAVLESPLTPNIPSAVSYRLHPDGRVLVVTQEEVGRAGDLISNFQEGVRSATPFLVDHFIANGYDFELLSAASKVFLKRYFVDPDPGVADIWFNSTHDDTFGALNRSPFGKGFDPAAILRAKGDLLKIPHALESGWPSGYMRWLPVHSIATQSALRSLYGS